MAGVEIDPLDASKSILDGLPEGDIREHIRRQLDAPASRRDLIDAVTAQTHLNASIAAAVLALWQNDQARQTEAMEKLLDLLQRNSDLVAQLTTRMISAPDPYRRRDADNG